MSAGPFSIISREPITIGTVVRTIRQGDAIRFENMLEGIEAPSALHPNAHPLSRRRGDHGHPSYIGATFVEIASP
jgi:hypothetical protein